MITGQQVLEYVGLPFQEKSNRLQVCCPFHHDTNPSAGFYTDTDLFHCFSCEITYDPVTFYAKLRELNRRAAAHELAVAFNLPDLRDHQTAPTYNRDLATRLRSSAEAHLATLKDLPRKEHGRLGETLDRIFMAHKRGQITDAQLDTATQKWYNRGQEARTDAGLETRGIPGTGPDDRLKKGAGQVPRLRRKNPGPTVAPAPAEGPDGLVPSPTPGPATRAPRPTPVDEEVGFSPGRQRSLHLPDPQPDEDDGSVLE
jgi:hypothetical protein